MHFCSGIASGVFSVIVFPIPSFPLSFFRSICVDIISLKSVVLLLKMDSELHKVDGKGWQMIED